MGDLCGLPLSWGAGLVCSKLVVLISGWSLWMESLYQAVRWTSIRMRQIAFMAPLAMEADPH